MSVTPRIGGSTAPWIRAETCSLFPVGLEFSQSGTQGAPGVCSGCAQLSPRSGVDPAGLPATGFELPCSTCSSSSSSKGGRKRRNQVRAIWIR